MNLTKDGTVIASMSTDSNGNYTLINLSPIDYTLTASKIRFVSNSTSITITSGETVTASVQCG